MSKDFWRMSWLVLLAVGLAGCETYTPHAVSPGFDTAKLKHMYVIQNPYSKEKQKRNVDVVAALAKRGIVAQLVQANTPPPPGMDAYITVKDHWTWDVTMYLESMQLELYDAHNGQLLASARYKQGWIHRYPTPDEIVDALVGQLLGEPPPAKPAPRTDAPANNS